MSTKCNDWHSVLLWAGYVVDDDPIALSQLQTNNSSYLAWRKFKILKFCFSGSLWETLVQKTFFSDFCRSPCSCRLVNSAPSNSIISKPPFFRRPLPRVENYFLRAFLAFQTRLQVPWDILKRGVVKSRLWASKSLILHYRLNGILPPS